MSDCTLCNAGVPVKKKVAVNIGEHRGELVVIVSPEVAKKINQAKEEMYQAIQAIEDGDLPFARSSSQRASGLIIEAWQDRNKGK